MTVWALADLHLPFGASEKTMEVFGPSWKGYTEKIASHWKESISNDDLILIAGDISWAKHLDGAMADLLWIEALPGTKLLIRGNHDYWWPSSSKLRAALPPSMHFIHNNVFNWKKISIGGTRLWDTEEFSFEDYIEYHENPLAKKITLDKEQNQKIFKREFERLKLSLSQLNSDAEIRIAMIHYPPISADLQDSQTSKLLEKYRINYCVFGHLHNIKKGSSLFGEKGGVHYLFTACDYLNFKPLKIL